MRTKRGNGQGSVFKRAADGKWCAQITTEDGRRRTRVRDTEREARQALRTLLKEQDEGVRSAAGRQHLSEWIDEWLTIKEGQVRSHSLSLYRSRLEHVKSAIGYLRLCDVTPLHISRLQQTLGATLSANTVGQIQTTLSETFKAAIERELIERNPCERIKKPRRETRAPAVLTPAQILEVRDHFGQSANGALFLLLVTTGMRIGEALALHWPEVDLDREPWGQIQVLYTRSFVAGGGYDIGPPKTARSKRLVPLLPEVVGLLRWQRHDLKERRLAAAHWTDADLVFPAPTGDVQHPAVVRRRFQVAYAALGAPDVGLHGLRHTAASLLSGAGEATPVVMALLGHTRSTMTEHYVHLAPSIADRTAETMSRILREAR